MRDWSEENARDRFDEVVSHALTDQPQRITLDDGRAVVVLSAAEFDRLCGATDLVHFLRTSPLAEALGSGALVLDRSADPGREIDL